MKVSQKARFVMTNIAIVLVIVLTTAAATTALVTSYLQWDRAKWDLVNGRNAIDAEVAMLETLSGCEKRNGASRERQSSTQQMIDRLNMTEQDATAQIEKLEALSIDERLRFNSETASRHFSFSLYWQGNRQGTMVSLVSAIDGGECPMPKKKT